MSRYSYGLVKKITQKFLKDPNKKGISKEIQLMQMSLAKFPDPMFWEQLNLGFKVESVIYFRRRDIQDALSRKFKVWQEGQRAAGLQTRLIEYDCDEKPAVQRKPRNNKEFLS